MTGVGCWEARGYVQHSAGAAAARQWHTQRARGGGWSPRKVPARDSCNTCDDVASCNWLLQSREAASRRPAAASTWTARHRSPPWRPTMWGRPTRRHLARQDAISPSLGASFPRQPSLALCAPSRPHSMAGGSTRPDSRGGFRRRHTAIALAAAFVLVLMGSWALVTAPRRGLLAFGGGCCALGGGPAPTVQAAAGLDNLTEAMNTFQDFVGSHRRELEQLWRSRLELLPERGIAPPRLWPTPLCLSTCCGTSWAACCPPR